MSDNAATRGQIGLTCPRMVGADQDCKLTFCMPRDLISHEVYKMCKGEEEENFTNVLGVCVQSERCKRGRRNKSSGAANGAAGVTSQAELCGRATFGRGVACARAIRHGSRKREEVNRCLGRYGHRDRNGEPGMAADEDTARLHMQCLRNTSTDIHKQDIPRYMTTIPAWPRYTARTAVGGKVHLRGKGATGAHCHCVTVQGQKLGYGGRGSGLGCRGAAAVALGVSYNISSTQHGCSTAARPAHQDTHTHMYLST